MLGKRFVSCSHTLPATAFVTTVLMWLSHRVLEWNPVEHYLEVQAPRLQATGVTWPLLARQPPLAVGQTIARAWASVDQGLQMLWAALAVSMATLV